MTITLRVVFALTTLGIISVVQAETVYVADQMSVDIRAEIVETSAVVKTVESGTPLEVVERFESLVHVRDAEGTAGWIEARFLTPDLPARAQLVKLQKELAITRSQTEEAQSQLKKTQTALSEQTNRVKALEKEVNDKPVAPTPEKKVEASDPSPAAGKKSKNAGLGFSYLWLGISFAMLGIGFAAGIKWLRESIRRRSGGMYLRV